MKMDPGRPPFDLLRTSKPACPGRPAFPTWEDAHDVRIAERKGVPHLCPMCHRWHRDGTLVPHATTTGRAR